MTDNDLHAIVYGPFKASAREKHLGINPMPGPRVEGSRNAEYGLADTVPILSRTQRFPSSGVVVTSAARTIIGLSKAGEKLHQIWVEGDDDPTLHPSFLELTENLRDLRNKWFPKAKLGVRTAGRGLEATDAHRALQIYDLPIVRFEWGTAKTYAALTGDKSAGLKTLTDSLRGVDRLVVHAVLAQGTPDNASDAEIKAWIKRLDELRPKEVWIETLDGAAKRGAKRKSITATRLERIASEVTEKTGLPVELLKREKQPA